MNINAGFIDHDHWINDKSIGGGRLIEKVVTLLTYLSFD